MEEKQRFEELFAATYAPLRRYALNRGMQGPDADDLVAEVLTVAWRRLDEVPADVLPWLFAVAHNIDRNRRRSRRRFDRMIVRALPERAYEPPDPSYEQGEIRRAMSSLNEADRDLLRLIAWDGLTPEQAAAVYGCSSATLRVRLHRARQRLAAALGTPVTPSNGRTDNDRRRQKERPGGPTRTL
ncbi:MAG TPA: sigma-70 family RNA polymerase sigma factor [Actinomycetota bacterium]|nr:sigma-70 family RNA polymerase sigma factor [Actinomycetota bacterium]